MKKRILYLDLPYHKKTRSSLFMLDLLKQYYDVDVFYYDPILMIIKEMHQIIKTEYDFLVCWQVMPEDYVLAISAMKRESFSLCMIMLLVCRKRYGRGSGSS